MGVKNTLAFFAGEFCAAGVDRAVTVVVSVFGYVFFLHIRCLI